MRECGTCSACCRWPEIPELEKPQGVTCPNLSVCGYGCTDYAHRPKLCAEYRCAWIKGHGAEEDQPDAAGVLIDIRTSEFGDILVARDLGRGESDSKAAAIDRISGSARMVCFLVANDNPQKYIFLRGPRPALDLLLDDHPHLEYLT